MANTVFASQVEALASLNKNKFAYTRWDKDKGYAKPATPPAKHDAYMVGFSHIAAFLCNKAEFERCLGLVSSDMWDVYRGLDPKTRNKFSRAMSQVALTKNFHFRPGFTANTTPIGIKLIGGDPQLGYMLRNQLFWKDSMELRHGEHSHSLQWLAIAQWNQAGIPAPELYALTADYRASNQHDRAGRRSMTLWQWLADCFPTDKNNYATEIFTNGETLESESFRSPQLITDYLLPLGGAPINDHFISHYLFHRYQNRTWLKAKTTTDWKGGGATSTVITAQYTGDPKAHRSDTAATRGWKKSLAVPGARLVRDPTTYGHDLHAGEASQSISASFHGNPGELSYFYE